MKLKIKHSKLWLTILLIAINLAPLFAQTDDVNTKLASWGEDIKTILNAVVGIFSFAGGFLIFVQYMQGNEQAQRNFIRFIIGLAIFGLVALIANIFLPDATATTTA
ncbi:hypothetical protein M0D21_06350 [Aquimarina sp. D1M17]|uniref:hypothetical protein n=1 Tax=Aquimarina acroporae TaxID=2937283 RepID=UPI0020BF9BC7|nr:hypothetical protein [Aquimarina acroporae]MCK8521178.1 hypothetical protein [Aquimarina acroporae]